MSEKQGRTSDAQSEYMKYLYEGSEFLLANQLQEARESLEKAMDIDPNDAKGLSLLGLIYYRLADYEKAERIYNRLVDRFPKEASLRVNLGLVLMMRQKPEEAVLHMKEAVRVQPDHQRAHIYLGHLYTELGDAEAARREFLLAGQEHMADKVGDRKESETGTVKPDYVAHDMDVTPRPQMPSEIDGGQENEKKPVTPGMLDKGSRVEMQPSSEKALEPQFETPPRPAEEGAEEKPVEQDAAVPQFETPPRPAEEGAEEKPVEQDAAVPQFETPPRPAEEGAEEKPVEQDAAVPQFETPPPPAEEGDEEKAEAEEAAVPQFETPPPPAEEGAEEKPVPEGITVQEAEHPCPEAELEKKADGPPKVPDSDEGKAIKGVEPFFSFAADQVLDPAGLHKEDLRVDKDGMLIAPVKEEIFIREAGLVAYSRSLRCSPALMRAKGKNLETVMEDSGLGRMFRVEGNGLVLSAPGSEGRFVVLELFDDFLYLKQEAVFAFQSSLYWENGRIRSSELEVPLIHLRGEGRLAMWVSGGILKARIQPDHPVALPGHYLLGWMGRVVPTVSIPGPDEPMAGVPVLECKGEGVLLLKP